MSVSDDDEIVFNRQKPSSFDDTPLPALTGKNPAASLMSQEDIDEDERLKREIWAEVEAAKAERIKREEEEKKRKKAERKKAKARDSAGDSEVSQKVLEARKKREEERKKFRQLRMQGKQEKPPQADLVVASPVKSPAASRSPADTVEIVATKPPPTSTRQPKPQPQPVTPEPEPEPQPPKVETPPAAAKAPTRRTLTPSGSDSAQKWKRAYMSVKSKYEAEIEGKEKMEQALAQYDKTINTLMERKTLLSFMRILHMCTDTAVQRRTSKLRELLPSSSREATRPATTPASVLLPPKRRKQPRRPSWRWSRPSTSCSRASMMPLPPAQLQRRLHSRRR